MGIQSDIPELIYKKLQGIITPDERAVLERWADSAAENRRLLDQLLEEEQLMADVKAFDALWEGNVGIKRHRKMERAVLSRIAIPLHNRWRRGLLYAAVIVCVAVVTVLMLYKLPLPVMQQEEVLTVGTMDKQAAEKDAVVLTWEDGQQIGLSVEQGGIVMGDKKILYGDNTAVAGDKAISDLFQEELRQLKLTTPQQTIYSVILADGTKVWLNAKSILRYPSRFVGNERIVELEGEAFFDVTSHNAQDGSDKMPFIVKTRGQRVEVLGTQFNISAYEKNAETITTLVEGVVRVSSLDNVMLKPNEQSLCGANGRISVKAVDVAPFVAWTKGYFYFKNTSFEQVIDQIAHWYNMDIQWKNEKPKETFTGKINKNSSLQSVVDLLNASNVKLHIQGQYLVVE
ncbi:DUF4974 domain-containing protein [Sphingobacterium sp. SGG-5]|uniref:FecR family protein n=1 Tax=Sphingobacterium sp. SGG-5 TaxID=2710881 RepID=UPI0013E9CFA2|nr:FecR family protein [Sphingobacterium sp. SGG-5]NGM63042.1 DUF4974 domain-containing protein [Sphingobacterium sp. SGG-5]